MKFVLIFCLMLLLGCQGLAENLQNCQNSQSPHVGGSLYVECPYENKYKNSGKCWCKILRKSCHVLVQSTKSNRQAKEDGVSLRDSDKQRRFTVTMENLNEGDNGSYSCGIMEKNDNCYPMCSVTVTVPPASRPSPPTVASTIWNLPDTSPFTEIDATENSSEEEGSTLSTHPGTSAGTTTTAPPDTFPSTIILQVLSPVILLLLLLVFLAAVILIRAHRKKKQALVTKVERSYENTAFTQSPQRNVVATTVYVTAGPPDSAESKPPHSDSQHPPTPEPYYEEIEEPRPAAHGGADNALYCTVGHPSHVQQ